MKKITELLNEKDFTISIELVPPRNGADLNDFFGLIERLSGRVDFVSVTKGAGGSLRGGTLPISYFAQEKCGVNTIAHFVCRERTKHEIENDLIDLYYFNIKNVLALRGDPPAGSNEEWTGDYRYAYLLVEQIKRLNNGKYIPRQNLDEGEYRKGVSTDFCILVAGHPEDPFEEELEHIRHKAKAGAGVIITQMVFSFEDYKMYVENLKRNGISLPVIAGIRPVISIKQADSIENFFKLEIPQKLKDGLRDKSEEEARKFGISYTVDMIKRLRGYGAPGAHLFVLNDIELAEELLTRIQ